MSDISQMLRKLVAQQMTANRDVVEHACELMLTTPGDRGVLVTERDNGTVRAELSEDVPFGEIHYRKAYADHPDFDESWRP